MSVRKRVTATLIANAFGQSVNIASLLLLTPLYISHWGAATYGEWLILSSIPAYLAMADIGIGSAAANEMTMKAGAKNHAGAQQIFRGAFIVALAAAILAIALGLGTALGVPVTNILNIKKISEEDATAVLLILSAAIALNFIGGVVSAGFRCCGRNAQGVLWDNSSRLLEAVMMGTILVTGHGPVTLCASGLVVRSILLTAQVITLRQVCPWLFTPRQPADTGLAKRLIRPSLTFMAFPLGNALATQGSIIIIGATLGASAVTIFSAMRTIARVPLQVTNMLNSAVWPEMSRAYGAGDIKTLRNIHRLSWTSGTILMLVTFGVISVAGAWLTDLWLGPTFPFERIVLQALLVITLFSAVWNASSVVLAAINAHARMGLTYVMVNLASLGVAYFLCQWHGWWGMLIPLLIGELILFLFVLPRALSFTQDTISDFFAEGILGVMKRGLNNVFRRKEN